jgi:hypothetical protein
MPWSVGAAGGRSYERRVHSVNAISARPAITRARGRAHATLHLKRKNILWRSRQSHTRFFCPTFYAVALRRERREYPAALVVVSAEESRAAIGPIAVFQLRRDIERFAAILARDVCSRIIQMHPIRNWDRRNRGRRGTRRSRIARLSRAGP